VIWNCWQDGTAYHPAQHRALQHLPGTQDPAAAPSADTPIHRLEMISTMKG
jgi:hypothetical protein